MVLQPLSPMPATVPRAVPSCQQFLDGLMAGNYDCDADKSVLEAFSNAILLRGERQEIRLRHKNGRVRIYTKQLMPRKSHVKTSQINKRRVAASRFNRSGGSGALTAQRGQTRPARGLVRLSAAEQVGLIAALSTSHIGFNRWRRALRGSRSGLARRATLPAHGWELASLPGKQVIVTGSGAHLVSLTAAIQERVSALCDAGLFVERRANDGVAAANASPAEAGASPTMPLPGSPPTSEPDVQITLGLDKGGDPETVKIVPSRISQAHPNSPSNTILVGVCPCDNDKYDKLLAMMETHLPQIDALVRDGVTVHGARRPVLLIFGSDYAAPCCLLGHQGASATRPCLMCKRTRWQSVKQAALDRRRFCHRAYLATSKRFRRDTVWYLIGIAVYHVKWQIGGSGDTSFLLGWHVPPLRQRESSTHGQVHVRFSL